MGNDQVKLYCMYFILEFKTPKSAKVIANNTQLFKFSSFSECPREFNSGKKGLAHAMNGCR